MAVKQTNVLGRTFQRLVTAGILLFFADQVWNWSRGPYATLIILVAALYAAGVVASGVFGPAIRAVRQQIINAGKASPGTTARGWNRKSAPASSPAAPPKMPPAVQSLRRSADANSVIVRASEPPRLLIGLVIAALAAAAVAVVILRP